MSIRIEMETPRPDLDDAVGEIMGEVFQVKDVKDTDSIGTIALWDSFGHMVLMSAVEKRFGITIAPADIIALTSVAALKSYLKGACA